MKIAWSILILINFFLAGAYAQQNTSQLIASLNSKITEVKSFNSDDQSEFDILAEKFNGFKIIGLGEATHGTREFYEYKAKLIKYLILHFKLKTVVFESDMVGMESINAFVMNDENQDLKKAMNGLLGIYRTQEVADLVRWIKDYNLGKPAGQKVVVAGMDANLPYYIASRILTSNLLLPYLDDQLKKDLAEIREMPERRNFGSARKKYLLQVAARLKTIVNKNPDSSLLYSHYIRLLEQSLNLINLDDIALNTTRDAQMAENIEWLAAKTDVDETVAVWGHNGHISADKWRGYKAMGMHLRKRFKFKYYALGLAVGEGYARLWNAADNQPFHRAPLPKIENTEQFEFLGRQLKYPNFFLSLNDTDPDHRLDLYFSRPVYMRVLGAQTVRSERDILLPVRIDKSFNGILFFRETNDATEMSF